MRIRISAIFGLFITTLIFTNNASADRPRQEMQKMMAEFSNPPSDARPRVWWHWEDGNVTKDGIRKDLEWMHRIGIGGYHHFDAGLSQAPVVEDRLIYMQEDWKEAFRYAVQLSDSLGMSVGIASSPGWSNTGGPWVRKEDAMKRLVWSSIDIFGTKIDTLLPRPQSLDGCYRDIIVVAMKLPESQEGFRAIKLLSPDKRANWNVHPYKSKTVLECSDDGIDYKPVIMIPPTSSPSITVNFTPTEAKFFRVRKENGKIVPENKYILYRHSRIEHAEEKAGFSSPFDLSEFKTTLKKGEQIASSDMVLDISSYMALDGTLSWKAPAGNWRIIRFGYTLTGKKNGPAPKEATGLEVDKLDKTAYRHYFLKYLDMYKDATGDMIGKHGINELLVDSYEAWWQTWTPSMMQEFELRRGYSMIPWMPVLSGEIIDSPEASEKFLFDWRRTIGDLYYENYAQIKDIAASYGIETVYLESQENGRVLVADGMDIKRHATVPMAACWTITDKFATHSNMTIATADMRESASLAHLYGRRWVAAESFTTDGTEGTAFWYTPERLKRLADSEFSCGVNRIFIHESSHQPLDSLRPGVGLIKYGQWFCRHETWAELAKPWTDYLARTSYMLSLGSNVADILVYYGEDTNVTAKYGGRTFDVPHGFNYDFINSRGLKDLKVKNGVIIAPSGASYRLLCIDNEGLPQSEEVGRQLDILIAAGAKICRADELYVEMQGIQKDLDCHEELRFVHRQTKNCDIYWINNPTDKSINTDLTLRCRAGVPSMWNPEDGKVRPIEFKKTAGNIVIHIEAGPDDAFFIVCSKAKGLMDADSVNGSKYIKDVKDIELKHWTLNFPEVQLAIDTLQDYTSFKEEYIKYFSGTCSYTTTVSLDSILSAAVIDLGKVGDLASLKVNGQDLGVLWRAPFKTDIGKYLHIGLNTIEIQVTNTWVNRLIGDAQPDCPAATCYTTMKFYEAGSPLQKAGLIGPVILSISPCHI